MSSKPLERAHVSETGKALMLLNSSSNFPAPATIEIAAGESGFLLVRYSIRGEFAGDTWHKTVEDAKAQARFEFGVEETAWHPADER